MGAIIQELDLSVCHKGVAVGTLTFPGAFYGYRRSDRWSLQVFIEIPHRELITWIRSYLMRFLASWAKKVVKPLAIFQFLHLWHSVTSLLSLAKHIQLIQLLLLLDLLLHLFQLFCLDQLILFLGILYQV